MRLLALALAALAAGLAVPAARADTAPVAAGSPAPGTDPAHATPLELLAGAIASQIAGRSVSARCEDDASWASLLGDGTDARSVLGFVQSPPYYVDSRVFAASGSALELSPPVCAALERFAEAAPKPTKCSVATEVAVPVQVRRQVTRHRVVHGKRRAYRAAATVTVTVTRTVQGPPVPCFVGDPVASSAACAGDGGCFSTATDAVPDGFWSDYAASAQAIMTLAHEAVHLRQDAEGAVLPPDDLVEAQAECWGMQWMPYVAERLGDTPDDAQAIAEFTWNVVYPGYRDLTDPYSLAHPYWSAECRPGGALDVRDPGATAWP